MFPLQAITQKKGLDPACHDHAITNQRLVLVADDIDWHATEQTDARGMVRFPLHDLPEKAFQTEFGGMHLTLRISGSESVSLSLPKDETAALLAALASAPTSRVATDRVAAQAAREAAVGQANAALLACQHYVDQGKLDDAATCWHSHSAEWEVIKVSSAEVGGCLIAARIQLDDLATCVGSREKTDDEVMEKTRCLVAVAEALPAVCGALDLTTLRSDREAKLDVAALKKRLDAKTTPIIARLERAAAAKAARIAKERADAERCVTNNVYSLIVSVSYQGADSSKLRGCSYRVAGAGRVETTTRDGWMIVTWANSGTTRAAFRTSKRYIDGTLLLGKETASYIGVRSFQLVDGSDATMLTFKLSN